MSSKKETKQKIGKGQMVILSTFFVVVIALSVFGCYGCSYQPVKPPTPDEARSITERIKGTTWKLDEAGGPTTIKELPSKLKSIEILTNGVEGSTIDILLSFDKSTKKQGELVYLEGTGFTIEESGLRFDVTIVFSNSRDGNSETLTLKGNDSNTYLYYLKI